MDSPFAGLIAAGTVEPTLEDAAEQRIRQHSSETYQRRDWKEGRETGGESAGGRHNRSAGRGAQGAGQGDAAAGARRHGVTGPQQPG